MGTGELEFIFRVIKREYAAWKATRATTEEDDTTEAVALGDLHKTKEGVALEDILKTFDSPQGYCQRSPLQHSHHCFAKTLSARRVPIR